MNCAKCGSCSKNKFFVWQKRGCRKTCAFEIQEQETSNEPKSRKEGDHIESETQIDMFDNEETEGSQLQNSV